MMTLKSFILRHKFTNMLYIYEWQCCERASIIICLAISSSLEHMFVTDDEEEEVEEEEVVERS